MPYTTPLRDVPSFPAAQGKIANSDGTPDRTYVTVFSALEEFLDRARAALVQLEFLESKTVAQLPSAITNKGARYLVTDATATTFMSVVAGGGPNTVPVFADGAAWRIG